MSSATNGSSASAYGNYHASAHVYSLPSDSNGYASYGIQGIPSYQPRYEQNPPLKPTPDQQRTGWHYNYGPPPSMVPPLPIQSNSAPPQDWRRSQADSFLWSDQPRPTPQGSNSLPPHWHQPPPNDPSLPYSRSPVPWSFDIDSKAPLGSIYRGPDFSYHNPLHANGGTDSNGSSSHEPYNNSAESRHAPFSDNHYRDPSECSPSELDARPRKQRRRNGEPPRDLASRRYRCEICIDEPRSFARPSALKIHMVSKLVLLHSSPLTFTFTFTAHAHKREAYPLSSNERVTS